MSAIIKRQGLWTLPILAYTARRVLYRVRLQGRTWSGRPLPLGRGLALDQFDEVRVDAVPQALGLLQVRQGFAVLLLALVDHAPLVVGPGKARVDLDGLIAQFHGLGVVALGVVNGGLVGDDGRVVGLEFQGLVKGLEGLVVTARLAGLHPLGDEALDVLGGARPRQQEQEEQD